MNSKQRDSMTMQGGIPVRQPEVISALKLLGSARVVIIEHKGERYELRLTRNEKLILTK